MHTLCLSTWFPFPPDNGSRMRAYYLLRGLAASGQHVTLVAFRPVTGPLSSAPSAGHEAQAWGVEVVAVDDDPYRHVTAPKAITYLSPIPMAYVRSKPMDETVKRLVQTQRWDAVVAIQTAAARYVRHATEAAKVWDLDASLTAQMKQRYLASEGLGRAMRWGSWQKAKRYERAMARHFRYCTVVSEEEMAFAREVVEGGSIEAVLSPNGVDCEHNRPYDFSHVPNSVVYNGAMTYQANYDAVRYFLSEIYPRIRLEVPDVTFKVTGSTKGVALDGLDLDESVVLTGYVEDIRPEVAEAAVCVIPLREGGGTRLKILEAMALGTPVVSTSKGAEGLAVEAGKHLLIADGPEAFARETVRLLGDGALRSRLAREGRRLVEERYDWRQIGRAFADLVEQAALEVKGSPGW